jgi:periplasmic protein TonB
MRLWLGLVISLALHAGLFCIPIRVHTAGESLIEELQFVLMAGGEDASLPPAQLPGNPALQPARVEPAAEPEEPPPPTEMPKAIVIPKQVPQVTKPKQPDRRKQLVREPVSPEEKPPQVESPAEVPGGQGTAAASNLVSVGGPGIAGGGSGGPIEAAFGSTDGPRFSRQVSPKYPRSARELGREGTVHLLLTIDERGQLLSVKVTHSAGVDFDEEAVRAVKQSSFSPAKSKGIAVTCRAHLPIRFVLRSSDHD